MLQSFPPRRQNQGAPARRPNTGTLEALTKIVGNHGGATAPPRKKPKTRNVPKGKAYGYQRKFGQPGANLGPLANNAMPPGLSDQSRQANFQRELGMNRRPLSSPRRSAPKPIY